jgi:hypothetical protein
MYKDSSTNGIIPIPRGIPPRTFGYRLPKKPLFPRNLNMIFRTAVPNAETIKTKTSAKIIDV